jgi:hypothetical protein
MGASGSINISNNIYISYDSKQNSNENIKKLCSQLKEYYEGYMIISSELVGEKLSDNNLSQKIESLNTIISHSCYIVICISEYTLQSYFQTIELNNIVDTNKNIMYIMTDDNYTPENTPYLKTLIKNNQWFLLTDEKLMENIKIIIPNTQPILPNNTQPILPNNTQPIPV